MTKKAAKPEREKLAGRASATTPRQATSFTGTRRVLATDEQVASQSGTRLRQPDERDESADQHQTPPRQVMKQAHADLQSGQQDTDARNRVAEVLPDVSKTPQNFEETNAVDRAPQVKRKTN